ncbi:4Fe-4S dicluster domain-containing protein [bacterium]|nr:4Fe-4S dicluster domain-containing protein [bacterium]
MNVALKALGVVGAGGAGFPTYVKAASQVEVYLANGAECEPLVHKDAELMEHYPAEVVGGMVRMMEMTRAQRGVFALKKKNQGAISALRPHLDAAGIELLEMGDFYPAGDEVEIVHLATGRLIPPGGLPLQVGCAVNNVETLYNVHRAAQGHAVTDKFLSVTGLVGKPSSFWVPLGTTFGDVLERAGGLREKDFALLVSGVLMGKLSFDLNDVVTKTTGGLIVLPRSHSLVTRKTTPQESQRRIGKSACDQCSYCTELCPRYLLGYDVQPHKVMRSLGFNKTGAELLNPYADLCCACGLCTLYACPEDLYPREACLDAKADLRAAGIKHQQAAPPRVHPMKDGRRVPVSQLRRRLKLEEYESAAPLVEAPAPNRVRLLLSQHVGTPARPVVLAGQRVHKGEVVARVAEQELGVDLHASIEGTVVGIGDEAIEIANEREQSRG